MNIVYKNNTVTVTYYTVYVRSAV